MKDMIFYVYVYADPRKVGGYQYGDEYIFTYEPFYVGKGSRRRDRAHLCESTPDTECLKDKIKEIKEATGSEPLIIRQYSNLPNSEARHLETDMIRTIGRVNAGTGPLLNRKDVDGAVTGYKQSEDSIKRRVETRKRNIQIRPEMKIRGELNPAKRPDVRKKIAAALRGIPMSDTARQNMSIAAKKRWKEKPIIWRKESCEKRRESLIEYYKKYPKNK
jgi:hypothetical protein